MVDVAAVVKSMVRDHLVSVEVETDDGYRYWSEEMRDISVPLWIRKNVKSWEGVSDVDCTMNCWCVPSYIRNGESAPADGRF